MQAKKGKVYISGTGNRNKCYQELKRPLLPMSEMKKIPITQGTWQNASK